MAVGDAHVFPGFLTKKLTQLFFPKSPTTFLTCFCRGERRKYAVKKVHLSRGSNSEPPGHEFDTFTTEPPRRGSKFGLWPFDIKIWAIIPFDINIWIMILLTSTFKPWPPEYQHLSHNPFRIKFSAMLPLISKLGPWPFWATILLISKLEPWLL